MKICDINTMGNLEYVVLLPKCDYDILDSVLYSFKNVFYLDYELLEEDIQILIDYINSNDAQLILFDYDDSYRLVLPYIKKSKKIKWIYKHNLAGLTDGHVRTTFFSIMEFYDRDIVDMIGCLDYSAYEVLKNSGYNVCNVKLDVEKKSSKSSKCNSIGILGNDYNPNHNVYNQLSALKLVDYDFVKLCKCMPATSHFIDFFGIKEKSVNNIDEVIDDNFVNLYCNFTFTNVELILKSLDRGVPCILGNTDIFDDYLELKKYLVLKSDDDINEIVELINGVKKNKKNIIREYLKFREDYQKKSKDTINKFLEG